MTKQTEVKSPERNIWKAEFLLICAGCLFLFFLFFAVYTLFSEVFRECNGGETRSIEVWDSNAGGIYHEEICANGSHWIWEKDPINKWEKAHTIP